MKLCKSWSFFRLIMTGAEEEWLLTDGDTGIPRAMALFIRYKCNLPKKGEVVGIRAALMESVCDIVTTCTQPRGRDHVMRQ